MQFLFWFSGFMIFYAYFGYPLCLLLISLFQRTNKQDNSYLKSQDFKLPTVTLIITAYNEEKHIKAKIEGSLAQDYPKDKLEIIVASDCSTDRTDEIVKFYRNKGVKLVRVLERKGKENAQKHAVDAAEGEILVFSDAATIIKPDGISNIVRNFQDPAVGCVSSEDKFIDLGENVSGEGVYVKYEMFLRKLESKVNTIVGLSGSFFAARRVVCNNWASDLQSDFNTLLNSVKSGLKGISDPNSHGYYNNIADEKKEFDRKTRTVLRGISVLMRNLSLLNTFKYGFFSWQLLSHKLIRWLVPFFLFFLFFSNALIMASSIFYFAMFAAQLIFYLLSYLYYKQKIDLPTNNVSHRDKEKINIGNNLTVLSRICYFFLAANVAILVAWWKYFKGERATVWEPSKR